MTQGDRIAARQHHHPGQMRHAGQQIRNRPGQFGAVLHRLINPPTQCFHRLFIQWPHIQQGVDEKAVTACGRHATGGGVRGAEITKFLQIGHDVAHRGRTQVQAGIPRQGPRSDWLAIANMALDQHFQ